MSNALSVDLTVTGWKSVGIINVGKSRSQQMHVEKIMHFGFTKNARNF
jgi:hypothetical protein